MRKMTIAVAVASSVLLGAVAQAGGDKWSQEHFKAADKDGDGSITLAEAQTGMPTLAEKFTSVDSNGDGKVSADELTAYRKSHDKSMEADETTSPPTDK